MVNKGNVLLGVLGCLIISALLISLLVGTLRDQRCVVDCKNLGYDDGDYNRGCYCLTIERVPIEALEGVSCEDRLVGR